MQMPFFWATWRISRARYLVRFFGAVGLKAYPFRNALGDDGDTLDLGELHELHGGAVDGAGRGEVDDGVDLGVLLHGLLDRLVNGKEGLGGSPVHFADKLAAKGVDDAGDGGGLALADEVEVEHALDSARLHAAVPIVRPNVEMPGRVILDEASRLLVEESVGGGRA